MDSDRPLSVQQAPLTTPIFEALTVEMTPETGGAAPAERARALLAELLHDLPPEQAEGWRVEPVHPTLPRSFDFLPPVQEEGQASAPISIEQAWELTHRLRQTAGVLEAQPAFELYQDNLPGQEDEVIEEELGARLAAGEVPPPGGYVFTELAEIADLAGEAGPRAMFRDSLLVSAVARSAPPTFSENDFLWSPKLVDAFAAWLVQPRQGTPSFPDGLAKGEGIRVGHPDSGFRRHRDLGDPPNGELRRILVQRGKDFVDRDLDPEDPDGCHGLGTASVLMSADNREPMDAVTGVAPLAELVPLRVAKRRRVLGVSVPVPILFRSGMRRLRQAIYHAVDQADCHVISISLGWLKNRSVHQAVKYAVNTKHAIVIAAAGNWVPFVVWPAAYAEAIAVAGCTAGRRPWTGSSRGSEVDVTGPAHQVWKATIDGSSEVVTQSSGTSYAAATTAGIAALWLAHWGRDFLLDRYRGQASLATVFRHVLRAAVDPPPNGSGRFGAGIVNARRTLETPLPPPAPLRSAVAVEETLFRAAPESTLRVGLESVAESFTQAPPEVVRREVSAMLGQPVAVLEDSVAGAGDELAFHILSNPELRNALADRVRAAQQGVEVGGGGPAGGGPGAPAIAPEAPSGAPSGAEIRARLAAQPLSGRLRRSLDLPPQ